MSSRVLIVEDDDRIRETTRYLLEDAGYIVDEAPSGEEGLKRFEAARPDLVLLDVMLPGIDGFETCRRLRRTSDVPIIMLTARTDSFDVVIGLEVGADDYITKPFVPKELVARAGALMRRVAGFLPGDSTIRLGDVEIEPDAGEVRKAGNAIGLTKTEFLLLVELARSPGRLFTREILLENVWGYTYAGDAKLVDTHIYRLRAKIEDDPSDPSLILTVRGLGYKAAA